MGGNVVYRKDDFIIFEEGNGYIVRNTKKPFENGHTHLDQFKRNKNCKVTKSLKGAMLKMGIDAINFVIHGKIPKKAEIKYLRSLQRLSNNSGYIRDIDTLIAVRAQKGAKQAFIKKRPHYNKR